VAVFTHVTVGTNDLATARRFYHDVLGTIGSKRLAHLGDGGSIRGKAGKGFFCPETGQWTAGHYRQWWHGKLPCPEPGRRQAFHETARSHGARDERAVGTRDWAPND
jgi:catechol 2,3-dioxygenase-like lactoylglutathione lyase family enzyme